MASGMPLQPVLSSLPALRFHSLTHHAQGDKIKVECNRKEAIPIGKVSRLTHG